MAKFNIIGFWDKPQSRWRPTKTCVIHYGTILVPEKDKNGEYEPGVLQCPLCGSSFLEHEASTEEGMQGKFKQQQTMIISVKKNKRYIAEDGNEITDPDLIADMKRGTIVVSYHEEY